MKNFLIILFAITSQIVFSQTYTINNGGDIDACDGTFNIGTHTAGDEFTMTICSDNPDSSHVSVAFGGWNFSGGDILYVYDGSDTSYPMLGAGSYDENNFWSPLALTAGSSNMTGCLTFVFVSNGGGSTFSGHINCQFSCQYFDAVIDSTSEQTDILYTDICQGETVTFYGSGDFPYNGGLYNQDNSQCTFTWDFGDGSPVATGQVVSHTYTEGGGYWINLTVRDQFGCRNMNDIDHRVRVSMTPTWTSETETICPGETVTIGASANSSSAAAHSEPWTSEVNNTVDGQTYLPDGNGDTYHTELVFDAFGNQTLDSLSMLESICVNMEHSWLYDLIIEITCPDGTTITLADPGGSTMVYVGEPLEAEGSGYPGVGWDYCFSPNPTYGLFDGDEAVYEVGVGTYMPAGSYTSLDPLDGLLGCPLNGVWQITITDQWAMDDGFIFSWGVNLAPWVLPITWGFENEIVSYNWEGENIISFQDSILTVAPTTEGTVCYDVTVTDDFGCEYDHQTCIEVLSSSNPICPCITPATTINFTEPLCYGDNITLEYSGTADSTCVFEWNIGALTLVSGDLNTSGPILISFPTSGIDYEIDLTVTHYNDLGIACPSTYDTISITTPTQIILTETHIDASCGLQDGEINLSVTGGTLPYLFDWDNDGTGDNDDNEDLLNIGLGTYNIIVTDNNLCTEEMSINITQPASFTLSETHENALCFGDNNGSIDILATGSSTYYYDWDTDGVGDNDDDEDLLNIIAGNYSLTVTDENDCQVSINVDITEPSELTISEIHENINCFGGVDGEITITANNGTPNYEYSLDNINFQTGNTFASLTTGLYTVYVIDSNSCPKDIAIQIEQPTQLLTSANPSNISCFGLTDGEIDLDIAGGTPPYTYNWSDGSHTEDIDSLENNLYYVTVEDANNCLALDTGEITEPFQIVVNDNLNSILCYGDETGVIDISVSGGVTPYTYNWNNQSITQDLNNIPAGDYLVTVTDNSGCSMVKNLNLSQPNLLIASLPNDYMHCNNDTEILATVEGGTTPYTYQWNNGSTLQSINYQTNHTETYTITVVDDNGCKSFDEITITITTISLDVFANKDTVCPGDPVLVTTNIVGGIPPFTIYDNGQISTFPVIVYPNGQETYTLNVVDACGNSDDANLDIYTHPISPLSFTADKLSGCAPLTVNFNQNAYSYDFDYIWNFDDVSDNNLSLSINPVHIFTEGGFYDISVNVTDSNGCKNQLTIPNMIEVYSSPEAKFEAYPDVVSILNPTIEFTNYSSGNYNNFWSFGDGDSSMYVDPIHDYELITEYYVTLIVESEKGCLDTSKHLIRVKDEFTLYIPTAFTPDNDGINDSFKAVGHGIDTDNYSLRVYDRWGELIWTTTDLYDTWNGFAKNGSELVQNGTYRWLVICKDFNGVEHTKSGNVTVIR